MGHADGGNRLIHQLETEYEQRKPGKLQRLGEVVFQRKSQYGTENQKV